jgi:uncharacterized protein YxeA
MKKMGLAVILSVLAIVIVVGCSVNQTSASQEDRFNVLSKQIIEGYKSLVIQDKETGCQYIMTLSGGSSIFPLVKENGQPLCKSE